MSTLEDLGISRISVHEAGHAIAAMYYERHVMKISKIPDPDRNTDGHILYEFSDNHFVNSVVLMAGELAVTAFDEQPDMFVAGSEDFLLAKRGYLASGGNPEDFTAYMEDAIFKAKSILSHPKRLGFLVLLAAAIEAQGELDADGINHAIRQYNSLPLEVKMIIQ